MTIPMTKLPGVPDASEAKPGMAHYEGSGPPGKTCGDCYYRGYYRDKAKGRFDTATHEIVHDRYRVQACFKYYIMMSQHGPAVDRDYKACRYFHNKAV